MNRQLFAFRDWVRQEGLPYSILAADAPVDELVVQLQKRLRIENHQLDVPRVGRLAELPGVPVVQFKESPWVVVYWSVGRSPLLQDACRELSKKLSARVIHFAERSTTQWSEWFLYQSGKDLESSEEGRNSVYFESFLRPQVNFKTLNPDGIRLAIDESLNELLEKIVLNVPSLALDCTDSNIEHLSLLKISAFPLGMRDFQTWIYQGHPEYGIFAVKAPIEQVGQLIVDQFGATQWQKDVKTSKLLSDMTPDDQSIYWLCMVQPTANPWTVVYGMIGNWNYPRRKEHVCQRCSEILQTRTIGLVENDCSGSLAYWIYELGQEIERVIWVPGDDLSFDSEIREEPELDDFEADENDVISQFVDEIFVQEGVYIPDFDRSVADPWLERVDCVGFPHLTR